jgi:arylsulfatase A-like enzyme
MRNSSDAVRRPPYRALFTVVLVAILVPLAASAAERRPNILLILGDNLGKDWFGCYGADGNHTPNIDRLAAEGLRFEHCYATALCSTTRVELYTGRYGFRTGWHTHHDSGIYGGGGFDPEREVCFARVLKSAGYATCITGKWQINDLYVEPGVLARHGFEEHLVWTGALVGEGIADERWKKSLETGKRELESRYWDPVSFRNGRREVLADRFGPDEYVDYLVDFIERNRERPFLAFYSCPLTHIPVVPTPTSPSRDAAEIEQFAGMVRHFDGQVGRLVKELERLSLRDDTLVVLLTDNGTSKHVSGTVGGVRAVGGLGTMSENGIDVPLIVNCPQRVPGGRVSATLTDCSDLFPTLVDLTGSPMPQGVTIDGHSLALEFVGRSDGPKPRRWCFTQYSDVRVVRDQRYKLYSTGKLFDVEADPLERTDLFTSTDPAVVAARTTLQAVLDRLPPDEKLPFAFRSSSAFQIEKKKQ